jgi:nucleoside-diphosphate-sugar epimerase
VRVLVTGNEGLVGRAVERLLADAGHEVVGFDLASGADIRDCAAVEAAARGCDSAVHLAAIPHDSAGTPEAIMATNVLGTWHVLLAARRAGLARVVHASSVQALGIAEGERPPDYLPVDDDHPRYARRPYGLSKRLGEDLCAAFTDDSGIATVCLRPAAVRDRDAYLRVDELRAARPGSEWEPYWEYGAFVDVRDVAAAFLAALMCPDPGHVRLLLAAPDIAGSAPGRELAGRLLPDVPWRGGPEYDEDPWRSLLDCRRARDVLGWRAERRWSARPRAAAAAT